MPWATEKRSWVREASFLVVVAASVVPRLARAEGSAQAAPPNVASSPATEAEGDPASLFRGAQARYEAGDTAGALVLMRRAYELSRRPELLFNLGELERELDECQPALRDYRAYLTEVTAGARREQAEQRVRELEAECPPVTPVAPVVRVTPTPPAPAPTPAPAPHPHVSIRPSPPAPYFTPLRIAGWSAVGASVITGTLATYFTVKAAGDESDLEASIRSASSTGFSREDKALESDGRHSAQLARALGISAVGLATVGVTLLLLPSSSREERRPRVSLVGGPTGFNAGWQTAF
jgi:hypothetical protein